MRREEKKALVAKQVAVLKEHDIYPVEIRELACMVVVGRNDLEVASQYRISNDVSIARRYF